MTVLAILGALVWAIIIIFAIRVIYLSSCPGYRRRKMDSTYCGEDRRQGTRDTDSLERPIFAFLMTDRHDRMHNKEVNKVNGNI